MNCLFLDESGSASFNGTEPVFSLGGIAIDEEEIDNYVARANEIKIEFFGRADFTFHEPMM